MEVNKTPATSAARPTMQTLWREFDEGLEWLHDRAWPLSGVVLLLPVVYLHHYLRAENIPVSIASASALATLPVLLAMVAFVFVALMLFLLMPALLLLARATDDGQRLVDSHRKSINMRWLGALATTTTLVFLLALWLSGLEKALADLLLLPAFLVIIVACQAVLLYRVLPLRRTTWDFRLICLFSSLVQLLIAVTVLRVAIAASEERLVLLLAYGSAGFVAVAAMQVGAARYAASTAWHDRPLTRALQLATTGLALLAFLPPAAAPLAGYALQVSATRGSSCVAPTWTEDASPHLQRHVTLRILFTDGDTWIARSMSGNEAETLLVPRGHVAGFGACPREPRGKA